MKEENKNKQQHYGAVEDWTSKDEKNNYLNKDTAVVRNSQTHSILGISLIVLGSFSFSCMFLIAKLMQGRANSFTLVFYRSLVQIVVSLWGVVQNNENPFGAPEARGWLLVRGGAGAAAVIAFFYAIQHLPLPDAVTLQFTTPPFAAAFAVCLAGEEWLRLDMIGAVVCILGVMLIAHPTWLFGAIEKSDDNEDSDGNTASTNSSSKSLAIFVALLGAALAGMAYMSVRLIGDRSSANIMVLYYACMSIPMVVFGSKMFLGEWSVWGDEIFSSWDYFMLLLTGIFGYGGQYFTNLGLQRETAATGTLATCSQIVFTYGFELSILHEPINGWSVAGTILILGFMVVVGYSKMKQGAEERHEIVAGESEEAALLFASERNVENGAEP